jgi:hypothetical protein
MGSKKVTRQKPNIVEGEIVEAPLARRSPTESRAASANVQAPKEAKCLLCQGASPANRIGLYDQIFVWVCDRCAGIGTAVIHLAALLKKGTASKK